MRKLDDNEFCAPNNGDYLATMYSCTAGNFDKKLQAGTVVRVDDYDSYSKRCTLKVGSENPFTISGVYPLDDQPNMARFRLAYKNERKLYSEQKFI